MSHACVTETTTRPVVDANDATCTASMARSITEAAGTPRSIRRFKDMSSATKAARCIHGGVAFLLLLIASSVVAEIEAKEEKKLNYGAMIGIALGCIIPIMISNSFNGVDNSPE